jgi:hypothetical protein
MTRLPGVLAIVDVRREHIAVKEAKKLGIPTVCLIDTDSDPDYADIPIPGNDDAMRAIAIVVEQLADAVEEGKRARPAPLVAVIEVVRARVVEVDRLLDEAQAQQPRVEVEVGLRDAGDGRDMVNAGKGRGHGILRAAKPRYARTRATASACQLSLQPASGQRQAPGLQRHRHLSPALCPDARS